MGEFTRPRPPLWWYFGEPWGSPSNEVYTRGATPTGTTCYHCGAPIADGDRGLVHPCLDADGGCWPVPKHIDCVTCEFGGNPCAKHKDEV